MSEEKFILVFLIVLFLIYLIYELYNYVKNKDNEEDDNAKQKNTFFDTLDIEIEKSGYEVGEWEKEVRKDLIPIIKVKTKYKPNKEISVLVGDYSKSSISNTIYILESMGIKTTIAKSGIEIVKRIKDGEKYDLIITNNIYDRGHCDGPNTLDHLKEIEGFNIPVIVLTISENERDTFVGYYGFDEYITRLLTQEKVKETFPKIINDLKFIKIEKQKSNKS